MRRRVFACSIVAVVLAACAGGASVSPSSAPASPSAAPSVAASPSPPPAAVDLTIFGAASLTKALEQVETAYEAANPGSTLTISTDSSAALRTQIEQGAAVDVFLSADTKNPQTLVDAGLTDGPAVAFAGNTLTVIVPTDNPAGITTPADLAKAGVKIIAAGDEVPITKYASEAIANLARLSGYPPDFAAGYAANVVSKEDNVSQVVAKIGEGVGEAGIVYVTDARGSDKVTPVEIPPEANVPATYPGVVVKATKEAEAAKAFLDWLAGSDGQAILSQFAFIPPPQ